MVQSRVPATIDALVTSWKAAGLTVWDGPVVTGDFESAVFVGYDADPDGDFAAAEATQDWAGLGAKRRSETITVPCAAVALIGDEDNAVRTARNAVYGLLETAAGAVRADPSLGQPPPFVAGVRPGNLFTEPTQDGMQARLVFSVFVEIARV